jgi:2-keto-4-pentenoate hydratase/2-oxohepta-3-ene-1,7-dioic acid hydratase in catechol pathway
MRWVRYDHQGHGHFGILEGDRIEGVDAAPFANPARTGNIVPLDEVRLLPPVMPPTFYAAGINYIHHVRNATARGLPVQVPKQADIGYRAINALVGNDAPIVVPADSTGKVQFEGELVVVIGREARHLSEADALSCVFGYTIGNDVSERTWQKSDRTFWRAKNAHTFKPMGRSGWAPMIPRSTWSPGISSKQ